MFGKPSNCKVIFMKLKEDTPSYEAVKQINHLIIQAMLAHEVLEKKELSHIRWNEEKKRYDAEQLHLTLMNAAFARDYLSKLGRRDFDATEVVKNH